MTRDGCILALDLATVIGFTVGPVDEKPAFGTYRLPKTGDELGPFGDAYDTWLRQMLVRHRPADVVMEAPMADGAGRTPLATSIKLKGLCFLTEMVCHQHGIRCTQMDAWQWKKTVCGTARVSKSMRPYPPIEVLAQKGIAVDDDNAADSYCIWLCARGILFPKAMAQISVGALL